MPNNINIDYEINSDNASLNNTGWMIDAACIDATKLEMVTDDDGQPILDDDNNIITIETPVDFYATGYEESKLSKEICESCPVKFACLQYALDNHERHGRWGGASPQELRQVQSIDADGFTLVHQKPIKCLNCGTKKYMTVLERRRTKTHVQCSNCGLKWFTKKLIGKRNLNW